MSEQSQQPVMTRRQRRDAERSAQRRSHVGLRPGQRRDVRTATTLDLGVVGRRRDAAAHVGRVGVLLALVATTIVLPVSTEGALSVTARAHGVAASASPTPAAAAQEGSVTQEVLGTDADLDEGTDAELASVPDAATLARIREAFANAKSTCAVKASGASGDGTAFDTRPSLFVPMVAGTFTVSSPYGYRIHPTLGTLKLHEGQDYAAPNGTPIYAAADGTVVTAGMVGSTGTVVIKHVIDGETWYTAYLHMYSDGIYVHVGQQVKAGELIAAVGSTGRSTGPHLHFEVRTDPEGGAGATVDPSSWLKEHGAADLTTDCQ